MMDPKVLHILVIEDHPFQRKVVVRMLQSLGIGSVSQAENGRQALEMLDTAQMPPPDIVMCDLEMPEMDGMEFLRHFSRQHPGTSTIIMSGMDSVLIASVEKMARKYGLRLLGGIEKPPSIEQFEKLLALHHESGTMTARASAAPVSFTVEEILHAVREQQIKPYLQPQVNLKTGQLIGAEALARWMHPELGMIPPSVFIPPLERSGRMEELTFFMLGRVAQVCRRLCDKGYMQTLSVNLSISLLSDTTLADRITQLVRGAGIEPHHIILEITESAAMTNVAEALENLSRLRMHGFGLSIDDFGTGFSNIKQLTRVPFTELKIDQSFVGNCASSRSLRVIVESSVDMAHKLAVKSVAEGMEKLEEWEMLKKMGCDVAQGYFIAKPMSCDAYFDFCEHYVPQ